MPLTISSDIHFGYEGEPLSQALHHALSGLVGEIASGAKEQRVVDIFNAAFGHDVECLTVSRGYGTLDEVMTNVLASPAQYLQRFWNALEVANREGIATPAIVVITQILQKHNSPVRIDAETMTIALTDLMVLDASPDIASAGYEPLRYLRLGARLGGGGFGSVYRITRVTAMGEFEFAIKLLDPSPFNTDRPKAMLRFQREVDALKRLKHRAIVPTFEAGFASDGKPYVLMQIVEGKTLDRAGLTGDLSRTLAVFKEILRGLEYAHATTLHRDLKPANIMIRESDQQPVILDFGCAFIFDLHEDEHLTTKDVVGTARYIPPGVRDGTEKRSVQQDVYACGMMLYEPLQVSVFNRFMSPSPPVTQVGPRSAQLWMMQLRRTSTKEFLPPRNSCGA